MPNKQIHNAILPTQKATPSLVRKEIPLDQDHSLSKIWEFKLYESVLHPLFHNLYYSVIHPTNYLLMQQVIAWPVVSKTKSNPIHL
jgi:hypothetical protein